MRKAIKKEIFYHFELTHKYICLKIETITNRYGHTVRNIFLSRNYMHVINVRIKYNITLILFKNIIGRFKNRVPIQLRKKLKFIESLGKTP